MTIEVLSITATEVLKPSLRKRVSSIQMQYMRQRRTVPCGDRDKPLLHIAALTQFSESAMIESFTESHGDSADAVNAPFPSLFLGTSPICSL